MTCNFVLLNSDRTEVLILGPNYLRDAISNDIAILDGIIPGKPSAIWE